MAPEAPFLLSRATEDDIEEIIDLQYDCFPPHLCVIFMGCYSKADLHKIQKKYVETMKDDPSDIWIKVVDSASGKIIAASNWKIHLNHEDPNRPAEEPAEWLEGSDLEQSQKITSQFNETRAKFMQEPFIRA